ncbi:DUF4255 domain-containing protein [Lewinella sp. W8]|uniref:DUF4255 domain-containing protein n=1 Tax=Lewinella sp. W8 TaxID=2528208 RepID=UPI001067A01E|nr:DUF4255 domain-containing protein [Lewinella sp. W8]MTB52938.1 DUF4255 domain-containing protein [Lewinella sp. W8]
MIHQVLDIIVKELNNFLKRSVRGNEDRAVLSALVDMQGNPAFDGENKMICTLVSLEQERVALNSLPGRAVKKNAPIHLNLILLFSAHFPGNYDEALKFLSHTIGYFQGKQVFTPQNTPGLPNTIERAVMEIFNMDLHSQSQLWGAVGAKMMPSAVMKLRMVSITRDVILEEVSEITSIETTSQPPSASGQ